MGRQDNDAKLRHEIKLQSQGKANIWQQKSTVTQEKHKLTYLKH